MVDLRVATVTGSDVEIKEAAVEEFRSALRGSLLQPGDAGYDDARTIFNAMFDRRPAMIVQCSGTADVIDAVNFARTNNLLVAVRAGGHGIAGDAICDDGLVIDLTRMNGVHVDRQASTVRVQGGATWGDVDRETQAFGLATPGGAVSTTGVAGLTLKGGIGWMRSKYGLSCDNLLSAEVVTADGEVVNASATENEELFWALRGGGGNFGVVTSFEFRLYPVGPLIMAVIPMYPLDEAPRIIEQWRDWIESAPDEVSSSLIMWTPPADPSLPETVHNQPVAITAAFYSGPVDEGRRVLQPLREFGTPIGEIVEAMPYRDVQTAFDPFFGTRGELIAYWKSLYVNELSEAVIEIVANRASSRSSSMTLFAVHYLGGAPGRVGAKETAFGSRDAPYMISIDGVWYDRSENDRHVSWVREVWDELQPHATGAVYLNFMGHEEGGTDEIVKAAFGDNYERLVDVKTKYDPANLFRLSQNIKPAS